MSFIHYLTLKELVQLSAQDLPCFKLGKLMNLETDLHETVCLSPQSVEYPFPLSQLKIVGIAREIKPRINFRA